MILSLKEHATHGDALDSTLEWYDDAIGKGNVVRFSPPPDQPGWQGYMRSLAIDRDPTSGGGNNDANRRS